MVRPYLSKFFLFAGIVGLFLLPTSSVQASEQYSEWFVHITDASLALDEQREEDAQRYLEAVEQAFLQLDQQDSPAGRQVKTALAAAKTGGKEELIALTKAVMTFDEEQHPIDREAEKQKLWDRLSPALTAFQAVDATDRTTLQQVYKRLNTTWTRVEAVVRPETAHYGAIETTLSFLRAAIESDPLDASLVTDYARTLEQSVRDFVEGKAVAKPEKTYRLSDGIALLKQALAAFQEGDIPAGQAAIRRFITIWPVIEGEVSTRNAGLYGRVESQTPLLLAKGAESKSQEELARLIEELSAINPTASYHFGDAALILLREGLEALVIVFALVNSLKASRQKKGLGWVYGGAAVGLVLSLVAALLLQQLFPAMASGANREILEGFVGIFAVAMMFFVGIWLHSKSSVKQWAAYMDRQMKRATATGHFFSLFLLALLAVFREGAETVLFYIGILPRIEWDQLLLGIGLALVVLMLVALLFNRMATRFMAHRLFFWMTWLIYALAFKMLGVSIHALQLTSLLPAHYLSSLPAVEWLGVFPTWEGLLPQLVFLLLVAGMTYRQGRRNHD